MSTITVPHPGTHEASEKQKKAAGVTDSYKLWRSQSGVESTFVSGQDIEDPPASIPHDNLTVAELREYAAEKDVDLGDATKKADILDALAAAGL